MGSKGQDAFAEDAMDCIRRWMAEELFEQVPMSICVLDSSLRVASWNKNFFAVFGDPGDKTCHQAYKNRDRPCETCAARKTFRDGVSRISEESGVDCIGKRADYVVHHSPVYDGNGRIAFVVNMSYDITDRNSFISQYNLIFDRAPCSLSVLNRDLRILRANEHVRERFGEAVGSRCFHAYKQQDAPCEQCPARRTFADGQVHTSREVRMNPGGACSYHLTSTAPLAEDRHGVSQVVEMSLDVTEVHDLSEELERQRAIRHDITESSLDALVAVDASEVVTIYNAAAEELFGVARAEVIQKRAAERLLPRAFLRSIRRGEHSLLLRETQITTGSGQVVPVRLSGTVLRMGRQVVGGAAFLQDLREIKELEHQNLRNERMATVGHTVTQLAHSIKNILTGLQGGIYDIKKGCVAADDERRDDGLETLERNFARIHGMVRDFLRLSKDHELVIETCDANEVACEVHKLFRPLGDKYGIDLRFDPCPSSPIVDVDPEAVHTCLSNLVSNAVEACLNHGKARCKVRIAVRATKETLSYVVQDTGCGMDEETKAKLFHSIFTTKGSVGTGLGLMMTKKIVEDHGGRVLVASRQGRGSTFTVELPLGSHRPVGRCGARTKVLKDKEAES